MQALFRMSVKIVYDLGKPLPELIKEVGLAAFPDSYI